MSDNTVDTVLQAVKDVLGENVLGPNVEVQVRNRVSGIQKGAAKPEVPSSVRQSSPKTDTHLVPEGEKKDVNASQKEAYDSGKMAGSAKPVFEFDPVAANNQINAAASSAKAPGGMGGTNSVK